MEPKRSPQEDDERLKKMMAEMGYPDNRTIYQALKQIIMETRLQYEDAWPEKPAEKPKPATFSAAMDRFERACMAYERLGSMKKDDEKTRQIRKDAIAEYADARRALCEAAFTNPSDETKELVLEERKRAAKIARYHRHHALWVGLEKLDPNEFGVELAARIEASILQGEPRGGTYTRAYVQGMVDGLKITCYDRGGVLSVGMASDSVLTSEHFADAELFGLVLRRFDKGL